MSLILDALRRAQSEHRSGATPGVHDMPAPVAPERPRGLHPAWLAVAIAATALIAALFWPRVPPPAATPEPARKTAVPTPEPIETATATQAPNDAPTASVPAAVAVDPVTNLDEVIPAAPRQLETTAPKAPVVDPEPARTAPATAMETEPFTPGKDDSIQTFELGTPPAMPDLGSRNSLIKEGPTATPLVEMSPDYRNDFPRITVDVHVHDEDPKRRFVLINLRRYREGQTTDAGLKIDEILSQAIIFSWRGERVLYPLQR